MLTKEQHAALSQQIPGIPIPTMIAGKLSDPATALWAFQRMLDLLAPKITLDPPPEAVKVAAGAEPQVALPSDPHDTSGKITASIEQDEPAKKPTRKRGKS